MSVSEVRRTEVEEEEVVAAGRRSSFESVSSGELAQWSGAVSSAVEVVGCSGLVSLLSLFCRCMGLTDLTTISFCSTFSSFSLSSSHPFALGVHWADWWFEREGEMHEVADDAVGVTLC